MTNKLIKNLLILSLFAIIINLNFVLAATNANVTVVTPGESATLSGASAKFNCTIDASTAGQNYTRARVLLSSASTANSTENQAKGYIYNTTATRFNGTIDTTVWEDSNDYIFKCEISNGTNTINNTRTGVIIDNTIPTAPTSFQPSSNYILVTANTAFSISSTVINANTTSCTCTLYINGNSRTCTTSYSNSNCSLTYNFDTSLNGQYTYTFTASDGTNSTTSSGGIINVNIPGGGNGNLGGGSTGGYPTSGIVSQTQLPSGETVTTVASPFSVAISNFFNSIINFFKSLFVR